MIGALLGTWLGTVPIALDWDRPWQVRLRPWLRLLTSVLPVDAHLWLINRLSGLNMVIIASVKDH